MESRGDLCRLRGYQVQTQAEVDKATREAEQVIGCFVPNDGLPDGALSEGMHDAGVRLSRLARSEGLSGIAGVRPPVPDCRLFSTTGRGRSYAWPPFLRYSGPVFLSAGSLT